mmetsp:Transcript_110118/g.237031  ORF Transcript_110118/g.237031 Transcript_110118/m.237031 type:complete len:280 (+) Transcript_110118:987-1826(+)
MPRPLLHVPEQPPLALHGPQRPHVHQQARVPDAAEVGARVGGALHLLVVHLERVVVVLEVLQHDEEEPLLLLAPLVQLAQLVGPLPLCGHVRALRVGAPRRAGHLGGPPDHEELGDEVVLPDAGDAPQLVRPELDALHGPLDEVGRRRRLRRQLRDELRRHPRDVLWVVLEPHRGGAPHRLAQLPGRRQALRLAHGPARRRRGARQRVAQQRGRGEAPGEGEGGHAVLQRVFRQVLSAGVEAGVVVRAAPGRQQDLTGLDRLAAGVAERRRRRRRWTYR